MTNLKLNQIKQRHSKERKEEVEKGIISINSCYTICHLCGNLLVRTFIETNDISNRVDVYIICGKCIKMLPEVIEERLKHPVTPKIYG